jgi:hypothetical protein
MELVIFGVATLVALIASLYGFAITQVDHVRKNWVEYRCNPIYMPISSYVSNDSAFTTFTNCTMKGFHDYAGFMMDPIMAEFNIVNKTIGAVGGTLQDMRGMMSDVRRGFLGIVGSVFGKIQNTMSSIQYIIIRMRTLMSRIVGIMMSFMLIFYTGMETSRSVVNGPIYQVFSRL